MVYLWNLSMSITPTWAITQPKRSGRWFAQAAKGKDRKRRQCVIKHLNKQKQHNTCFQNPVSLYPECTGKNITAPFLASNMSKGGKVGFPSGRVLFSTRESYFRSSRTFWRSCIPFAHPTGFHRCWGTCSGPQDKPEATQERICNTVQSVNNAVTFYRPVFHTLFCTCKSSWSFNRHLLNICHVSSIRSGFVSVNKTKLSRADKEVNRPLHKARHHCCLDHSGATSEASGNHMQWRQPSGGSGTKAVTAEGYQRIWTSPAQSLSHFHFNSY